MKRLRSYPLFGKCVEYLVTRGCAWVEDNGGQGIGQSGVRAILIVKQGFSDRFGLRNPSVCFRPAFSTLLRH